jgi:hypothetical protein
MLLEYGAWMDRPVERPRLGLDCSVGHDLHARHELSSMIVNHFQELDSSHLVEIDPSIVAPRNRVVISDKYKVPACGRGRRHRMILLPLPAYEITHGEASSDLGHQFSRLWLSCYSYVGWITLWVIRTPRRGLHHRVNWFVTLSRRGI